MHRSATPALFATLLLAACGGGEAPADAAPDTGMDAPDRIVSLDPEAVYQVGGFDAPQWAEFGEIDDLVFDGRGYLYVLDGQTNVISKVAPDGSFVGTVGRPGEGPGEVRSPTGLIGLPEGGVAVIDFGHRAHVVYDSTGTWVENVRLDIEDVGMPRNASAHPDGGVVGQVGIRMRMSDGDDEEGEEEDAATTRPVAWFPLVEGDSSRVFFRAWDLPELEADDAQELGTSGGNTIRLRMTPERAWEPPLRVVVLPDGRVAVSDSTAYRIKLVDLQGMVVGSLERPIRPTQVTPAIEEAEKALRLARFDSAQESAARLTVMGGGSGFSVDPSAMQDMMRNRTESMVFADEIPVVEELAVDGYGRLWVQRSSGRVGEDGPTDLITADGRYLGSLAPDGLRIPDAFGPDGLVARVETDEFDIPTVVVERLPAEVR